MGWNYHNKPPLGWPMDEAIAEQLGFVGYWLNGAGSTIVDSTKYRTPGTFNNANLLWVPGKSGSAVDLPGGLTDYIHIPAAARFSFAGDKPFSLIIRAKADAFDGLNDINWLFTKDGKDVGTTWHREWVLRTTAGKVLFMLREGDNADSIQRICNTALSTGQYYDIVATYDGSKARTGLKIHIDGVRKDDTDAGSATYAGMTAGPQRVIIGDWDLDADASDYNWNGQVEYAGICNRELTASEAMRIHREPYYMFQDLDEIALLGGYQVAAGIPIFRRRRAG